MLTDNDLKSYINGYLQDRKMSYTRLDKHDRAIEILINENKHLLSIIKEVRELRKQLSYQYYENGFEYDTPMLLKDLDKILDKVGETDG